MAENKQANRAYLVSQYGSEKKLKKITEINLWLNDLTDIHVDTFASLVNLTTLDLRI
jgi:hypothetical protein